MSEELGTINNKDERPVMVSVICTVFNHEPYLRQCLDGFVMQKTNFRFEAIVHDDASTDKSVEITKEYAEKYPSIIIPILEKENQYSKHDGSLRKILDCHTKGKYVAICEGDDYWTDPLKLQKQFDFMEAHPECSLCFHAHQDLSPSGEMVLHRPNHIKQFYMPEDVILAGGGFMATNAMFYRWEYVEKEGRPNFWKNCPIGDLPSMFFLVSKGKFGFIDEPMSVYRVSSIGSWKTRQNTLNIRTSHYKAIMRMLNEYDEYTSHKYHQAIVKKKWINKKRHFVDVFKSSVKWLLYNKSL